MTFSTMGCGFMLRPIVRIIRAVLLLVLIALAFFSDGRHGGNRRRDGLVGLVLIAAGTFNLCVVAPFVGGYFDGRKNLEGMSPSARRGHRGAPQQ